MSQQGKNVKADYIKQVKEQYKGKLLTDDIEIYIRLYFGTKRRSDWDNFHKLSMDALTGIIWEDDSQIVKAHVEKYYCKENPRIEIKLLTV